MKIHNDVQTYFSCRTGDKKAEKTIHESLAELDVVIDSFKEREYQSKSRMTSPAVLDVPMFRSPTRLKLTTKKRKTTASSTTGCINDVTHANRVTLTPLDQQQRATDSASPEVVTQVAVDTARDSRDEGSAHSTGSERRRSPDDER